MMEAGSRPRAAAAVAPTAPAAPVSAAYVASPILPTAAANAGVAAQSTLPATQSNIDMAYGMAAGTYYAGEGADKAVGIANAAYQAPSGSAASNASAVFNLAAGYGLRNAQATRGTPDTGGAHVPLHHPVLTTSDPLVVAAYKPARIASQGKGSANGTSQQQETRPVYGSQSVAQVIGPAAVPAMIGPESPYNHAPGWASYNAQATSNQGYAMSGILDGMAAAGYGPSGKSVISDGTGAASTNGKKRKFMRAAGGEVWEDPTLGEWDDSKYLMYGLCFHVVV